MNTNPWIDLPEKPPFILGIDRPLIEGFNSSARDEHRVETALIPEPFLGNPDAPLVLLNLNPGVSTADHSVHTRPDFRIAARANLMHAQTSWPLFLLDPSLPDSPGRAWWRRKLGRLTDEVGEQQVASSVFVIEIHGYHSLRYSSKLRPPSQSYASYLVRCAIGRGAYIVVMRGRRAWESLVPELTSAEKVVQLRNPQNPVISPANAPEHFAELVSAIGA